MSDEALLPALFNACQAEEWQFIPDLADEDFGIVLFRGQTICRWVPNMERLPSYYLHKIRKAHVKMPFQGEPAEDFIAWCCRAGLTTDTGTWQIDRRATH